MEKVTSPDVRWYGAVRAQYTPLGTSRLPRPGWQNDTLPISTGITGVVLQDSSVVFVGTDDYHLLCARGWIARWTARKVTGNNFYPSINHGGKIRPIARIILNAGKDEKVRYRDGNQLNLTRGNLSLRAKGGTEIDGNHRSCPIAPIVGSAESGKAAARVAAKVGNASPLMRATTAAQAVQDAAPRLHAARTADLTQAPIALYRPDAWSNSFTSLRLPAKADQRGRPA